MKAVIILVVLIGFVFLGLFNFIPTSVQIFMAGVAPCSDYYKSDEKNGYLVKVINNIFRVRYMEFDTSVIKNDSLYGSYEIIRPLLLASDETNGMCNAEIEVLYHRFVDLGSPIDYYMANGATALHEAIISGNKWFVVLLLESGADPMVPLDKKGKLNGLNSLELAKRIESKDNQSIRLEITALIEDKIHQAQASLRH